MSRPSGGRAARRCRRCSRPWRAVYGAVAARAHGAGAAAHAAFRSSASATITSAAPARRRSRSRWPNCCGARRDTLLSDPRLWRQAARARSSSSRRMHARRCRRRAAAAGARRARDRRARPRGRRAAARASSARASIVMDDGFQNPSLRKDLAIVVVDSGRGIGNGRVFPAGPLRAPLDAQLARTDALVVIGDGAGRRRGVGEGRGARRSGAACAVSCPIETSFGALRGRRVLAFAGIGDPGAILRDIARLRHRCGADACLRRPSSLFDRGDRAAHLRRRRPSGCCSCRPKRTWSGSAARAACSPRFAETSMLSR